MFSLKNEFAYNYLICATFTRLCNKLTNKTKMPTKQISAIDWLANEIAIDEKLLKLAKAIEKHQILEAYHVGYSRAIMPKDYNAQEYYNENFNKD